MAIAICGDFIFSGGYDGTIKVKMDNGTITIPNYYY